MTVCCCSLAGTAACQHCRNNPMATDVWTNKTVTVVHVEAKPFGNGIDVCPVCGKPSTIGKPITNADRIRAMTDEELAEFVNDLFYGLNENPGMCDVCDHDSIQNCKQCWLDWMRQEATDGV